MLSCYHYEMAVLRCPAPSVVIGYNGCGGMGVGSEHCPRVTSRTVWKGRGTPLCIPIPSSTFRPHNLSLPPTPITSTFLPGHLRINKSTSELATCFFPWSSTLTGLTCSLMHSTICSAVHGRRRMDVHSPRPSQHYNLLTQFNPCVYRHSNADDF